MHFPFLVHATSAFSLLARKVAAARAFPPLRRRSRHYRREKGVLRLELERSARAVDDRSASAEPRPPARVFLVGCERSGTTLLQSLLAAHASIHSVPETHFVKRLFRNDDLAKRRVRRGWLRRLLRAAHAVRRDALARAGWISRRHAQAAWQDFGADAVKPASFWGRRSARAHMRGFVDAMDAGCRRAEKRIWLEKTPEHLYYLALIRRHVPSARFIHIVRDGREVVASLNRLAKVYPEWQPYLDVGFAVARWNRAWRETEQWVGHPGHLVVRYETLLRAPRRTLAGILRFLDCNPGYDSWSVYPQLACRLIRADEPWKAGNLQGMRDCRKFATAFDPVTRSEIVAALEEPDWRALSSVPGVIADSGTS